MFPFRLLPVLLVLLAACTEQGGPDARRSAVALHWTLETPEGRFLGSATALGEACLLTNQHVVAAASGRGLVARQGPQSLRVGAVRIADGVDAALLVVPHGLSPSASLRHDPPGAGEWLAVAGAVAAAPMVEVGEALGSAQSSRFGREIRAARLPVAPGFSGGPVVDGQGRLVGIVVAAAAGSLAEAQRLAAGRPTGALRQQTALLLDANAVLAALGPGATAACAARAGSPRTGAPASSGSRAT